MKKMIWIALALLLVFIGAASFARGGAAAPAAPTPSPVAPGEALPPIQPPSVDEGAGETSAALRYVDLEALHARYAPDMVYARVGDSEITWEEYYQWLGSNVLSAESYLESMAAYGMPMDWSSPYDEQHSFASYVVESLNDNLRVYRGIDLFAAQEGIEVSDEEIAQAREQELQQVLGADATEADFAALLARNFLTDDIYRTQLRANLIVQKAYDRFYGANGEKLSEAELQEYLDSTGYLRSNHILFLTVDMTTGEALDEAVVADKKAQAEALSEELRAITDTEALLALFAERKNELDEDSGKVANPDGYVFTPGRMVPAFEEATRALALYQVSEPVLSDCGYHVILRLPITADTVLESGSTAAAAAASDAFARRLDAVVDTLDFRCADGAAPIDLLACLQPES